MNFAKFLGTPFLQNTSRRVAASEFPQKDIDEFNVRQRKVQKKIIYGEKKGKHVTEGNELKCQGLPAVFAGELCY